MVLALAVAAVTASPAVAQRGGEELIGDRPDFTESAETVSRGRLQLEAGYSYLRDEGETAHDVGQALLRYGFLEDWELRFGLGSWVDAGAADGWTGGSLGLKVHMLDNWELRPSLAILLSTTTPFGDVGIAPEEWQPGAKLALGWELTESLSLGVNGGYARLSDGDERFDQLQWSASLGWSASDRLGFFGEVYGFDRESFDGRSTQYLDGGATWLLRENLQLDAWAGAGLDEEAADWVAGTGVVARW